MNKDILHTIKSRRSTLTFKNEEINLDLLKEIFTYASYAPTHYMTESWRIKLYQGAGKKHLVDAIIKSYQRSGLLKANNPSAGESIANFLLTIPHHALIYFERQLDPVRNEEEYASVAAFIQNAQLAAWELNVGILWTITPYMHDEAFIKDVGLDPERHKIAAVLQMGYPDRVTRFRERMPVEEFMEVVEG
ncbi:nitroreductase family protein [Oceanobacillus sp. CAU 1775]